MGNKQLKPYALVVSVKPKPVNGTKYGSKIFKGVALAENPTKAKQLAIEMVLNAFDGYDGSSEDKPLITRYELNIKECKLYGDFIIKSK